MRSSPKIKKGEPWRTGDSASANRAWHLRQIKAQEAWDAAGSRGEGILVGHCDTGYTDHPELEPLADCIDIADSFDYLRNQSNAEDPLTSTAPLPLPHGHSVPIDYPAPARAVRGRGRDRSVGFVGGGARR
jgi:hypothetical protein